MVKGTGKFCSKKCKSHMEHHPNWKNGIMKRADGYILIKTFIHPYKPKNGYIREHRLIIEKQIGRFLHRWEIVHHINGKKDDNRPENLMVFKGTDNHSRFEAGSTVDSKYIIFDGKELTTKRR